MSGPQLWQTIIGRTLIERDVPKVANALERIAVALETIAARLPATTPPEPTAAKAPPERRR
jgi:hypothetical protein